MMMMRRIVMGGAAAGKEWPAVKIGREGVSNAEPSLLACNYSSN